MHRRQARAASALASMHAADAGCCVLHSERHSNRGAARERTGVDDVALCVQVVKCHKHLAGEAAHHMQRDAAVVVQPEERGHAGKG